MFYIQFCLSLCETHRDIGSEDADEYDADLPVSFFLSFYVLF